MIAAAPLVALAAVVLLAASFFAAAGLGGGFLYWPALIAGGVADQAAVGTSCALVALTGMSTASVYASARHADWKAVVILGAAAVTGALAGGLFTEQVSTRPLSWATSVALLACSLTLVGRRTGDTSPPVARGPGAVSVVVLCAIGAVGATDGIGGGALILAYLIAVEGLPTRRAIGTSSVLVALLGASSTFGHMLAGHVKWVLVAVLAPFILVGCLIGAQCSLRLSKRGVEWGVAALTAGVSVVFAYRAFGM